MKPSTNQSPAGAHKTLALSSTAAPVKRIASFALSVATALLVMPLWSSKAIASDSFASSQELSGAGGSTVGTNVGATKEPDEPLHAGNEGGASIWYRRTASATGPVAITTLNSDFDTLLAVYTGSTVGALTPIASNDDISFPSIVQSRVVFTAVAGTTYHIAVDGFNQAMGNALLSWLTNDTFTNAQVLSGNNGLETGNNTAATKESGEPSHAGNAGGRSAWYWWTAPASGSMTISTAGSGFDTLLAVYTGTNVGALDLVADNDNTSSNQQSHVTFAAASGTTYRIAVDGFNTAGSVASGNLTLSWTFTGVSAPVLEFARSGPLIVLSWGTNDASFTLQGTGNLTNPASWTPVAPAPSVVNGKFTVTNTMTDALRFYRLIQ